eukprot:8691842-Alexandrium_andersonii.AAC.1
MPLLRRRASARRQRIRGTCFVFARARTPRILTQPNADSSTYRIVVQGGRVVDQNNDAAIFQGLGSAPAVLEASRIVDADGAQSLFRAQAELKVTPPWVCHPPGQRFGKAATMKRPVDRLKKALYGHPGTGAYWEQQRGQHAKSVGSELVGEEGPSCDSRQQLRLLLIICVDDFKLVGPVVDAVAGRKLLRKGLSVVPLSLIHISEPTRLALI